MEIDIAAAIKDFGFPVIAAFGMGYFIFFIWKWVTEEIDPVLGATMGTLIKLVDRIRMLDNDMIRMNMKLSMVLEHRHLLDKQLTQEQKLELDAIVDKYQTRSKQFDSTGQSKPAEPKKKLTKQRKVKKVVNYLKKNKMIITFLAVVITNSIVFFVLP